MSCLLNALNMNVKIRLIKPNAKVPEIKSAEAAGADLYACIDEPVNIEPGITKFIPLGFQTQFSKEYVALIYARSGLSCNQDLAPANKVGVIDSDYRGEWMVALHNHGSETRIVQPGDRIAQVLFQFVGKPNFNVVDNLDTSERGEGGFNSTGSN